MTRRTFLEIAATAASIQPALQAQKAVSTAPPTQMGVATTSYLTAWQPKDTYEFLEHCHALGAAGIQSAINGDLKKIRSRAEQLGMYIEGMASLPKNGDTSGFERAVNDAKTVGAICIRAASLGGRRYETFSSLSEWQHFVEQSNRSIEAALPLLEKHRIPLALENHKDRTVDELVTLLKKHASEYLGVCLDFGNNISLLDDPMEVVERLATYTISTHVKDMGVGFYEDGFLLSEVVLGEGFLDLPRMISAIRNARPKTRLSLEMITRDPLKVPCLTDKYWATFPDRNGRYLARTLKLVQTKLSRSKPLPRVSQLNHQEQLRAEDDNVKACLAYAREKLRV